MFIKGCLLLVFVGFGCGSSSSPKQVLAKFLTAMEHGDFKEAKKYATADSQSFLNMIGDNSSGSADVYKDQDLIVTDNVVINGSEADVEVKTTSGGTGMNFHLQKENGNWKVSFNMGSLLNTAIDAIKKAGPDVQKDVKKALDSLKVGLDSIH